MNWMTTKGVQFGAYATTITPRDLAGGGGYVRLCPMIYQERIDKTFDYRALVLGESVLACEIRCGNTPNNGADWRIQPTPRTLGAVATDIPQKTSNQLVKFLRRADLLMGAFDLALTPDGEWVFFDVNEQGQTLWVEEIVPELTILDAMAEFLISPRPDFKYSGTDPVRYASFRADRDNIAFIANASQQHAPFQPIPIPLED